MQRRKLRQRDDEVLISLPREYLEASGVLDEDGELAETGQSAWVELEDPDQPAFSVVVLSSDDDLGDVLGPTSPTAGD